MSDIPIRPLGHEDCCMCQDCIEWRNYYPDKELKSKPVSIKPNNLKTLKELYQVRRNGRLSIFGTVLGAYSAFWQWFLIYFMWGKCSFRSGSSNGSEIDDDIKNLYQFIHIPDGYALVFLGWIMWVWWIICSIIVAWVAMLVLSIFGAYFIILGCLYVILSLPYPILILYSIIFEFPASALNRDFGKIDLNKYDPQLEWSSNTTKNALNCRSCGILLTHSEAVWYCPNTKCAFGGHAICEYKNCEDWL